MAWYQMAHDPNLARGPEVGKLRSEKGNYFLLYLQISIPMYRKYLLNIHSCIRATAVLLDSLSTSYSSWSRDC